MGKGIYTYADKCKCEGVFFDMTLTELHKFTNEKGVEVPLKTENGNFVSAGIDWIDGELFG